MYVTKNIGYGRFGQLVPNEIYDEVAKSVNDDINSIEFRSYPKTIKYFFDEITIYHSQDHAVAYIPDEATDTMLSDYDGFETIYYVLDGKIHVAQTALYYDYWNNTLVCNRPELMEIYK